MLAPEFPRPLPDELVELLRSRIVLLGDQTRIRILDELRDGERNVQSITDALTTTQQNVSGHLRLLRAGGLVMRRQSGRTAFYSVTEPAIFEAWRACLR